MAEAYPRLSALRPQYHGRPKGDHPDAILIAGNLRIGLEITEVDQDYSYRAWCDRITNAIYAEFAAADVADRLLGVGINVVLNPERTVKAATQQQWAALGIRNAERRVASDPNPRVAGAVDLHAVC